MIAHAALALGVSALVVALVYAAWRARGGWPAQVDRPQDDSDDALGVGAVVEPVAPGAVAVTPDAPTPATGWTWPAAAEPFRAQIEAAAHAARIPADLLARVLWQESRFRVDVIEGRTRSRAGALGIAQFMPATAREAGIDPLDPSQAIPAAARYLRRLFDGFGSWPLALAAYNWGQGNVRRRGLARAPAETREYVASITRDVPEART